MAHVTAQDIFVDFPIYGANSRSFKKALFRAATGGLIARDAADRIVVRALNGVSFELRDGDRVGLVGHNGSGKSTLLRVLAGAYEPVRGTVEVNGRVASMLNIQLVCAISGAQRATIGVSSKSPKSFGNTQASTLKAAPATSAGLVFT